jgi:transposase
VGEVKSCGDDVAGPAWLFDVPEMRVRVTAHLLHVLACAGCGARTRAVAPAAGCRRRRCMGRRSQCWPATYLAVRHHIPVARVVEILADLAGIDVSVGWVMTACARMAAAVAPANEAIKDAIAAAPVAHWSQRNACPHFID